MVPLLVVTVVPLLVPLVPGWCMHTMAGSRIQQAASCTVRDDQGTYTWPGIYRASSGGCHSETNSSEPEFEDLPQLSIQPE